MTTIASIKQSPQSSSRIIFPKSETELITRAHQLDLLNTYDTPHSQTILSKIPSTYRTQLITKLLENKEIKEDEENFIQKTTEIVDIIENTTITEKMRDTIIQALLLGWHHNSRTQTYTHPHLRFFEIKETEPEHFVEINMLEEGHKRRVGYMRHQSPQKTWDIINRKSFSDLESKLIQYIINKKPYNTNHTLRYSNEQDMINAEITFFREGSGRLRIKGGGGLKRVDHLDFKDLIPDQHIHNNPQKLQEALRNSNRYKTFTPDFEKASD